MDGVHNITEAQQRVARQYFEDGSIDDACPPLRALLLDHGRGLVRGEGRPPPRHPPAVHAATRSWPATGTGSASIAKQRGDERLWRRHLDYLDALLAGEPPSRPAGAELRRRRDFALAELERIEPRPTSTMNGTLGLDPSLLPPA